MAKAKKTAPKKASGNYKPGIAESDSMLKEFFVDELKDIYWAEKHIVKTLPKMQKAATSDELKNAFQTHTEQSQEHVSRLEQAFELLGEKAQAKKCEAMAGIIEEGEGIVDETEEGTATRDVGLILAAQKVEHYEISTYGGLTQLATTLGLSDVAELLSQTLQEEKDTDELLSQIAKENVNYQAASETE